MAPDKSAKTTDLVIWGILRGESSFVKVFLLMFTMEKNRKSQSTPSGERSVYSRSIVRMWKKKIELLPARMRQLFTPWALKKQLMLVKNAAAELL